MGQGLLYSGVSWKGCHGYPSDLDTDKEWQYIVRILFWTNYSIHRHSKHALNKASSLKCVCMLDCLVDCDVFLTVKRILHTCSGLMLRFNKSLTACKLFITWCTSYRISPLTESLCVFRHFGLCTSGWLWSSWLLALSAEW